MTVVSVKLVTWQTETKTKKHTHNLRENSATLLSKWVVCGRCFLCSFTQKFFVLIKPDAVRCCESVQANIMYELWNSHLFGHQSKYLFAFSFFHTQRCETLARNEFGVARNFDALLIAWWCIASFSSGNIWQLFKPAENLCVIWNLYNFVPLLLQPK